MHVFCDTIFSENDPLNCDTCMTGTYKAWDTTRCWEECPDTYSVWDLDQYGRALCGPVCDDDQYNKWNLATRECTDCNLGADGITDCDQCELEEDEKVRC
jgi:hypothetical protein